jgi:hypothetical protein
MIPPAEGFVQHDPVKGTIRAQTFTERDMDVEKPTALCPPLRERGTHPLLEPHGLGKLPLCHGCYNLIYHGTFVLSLLALFWTISL